MKGVEVSPYLCAKIHELRRDRASCKSLAEKFDLHLSTIYWALEDDSKKKKS